MSKYFISTKYLLLFFTISGLICACQKDITSFTNLNNSVHNKSEIYSYIPIKDDGPEKENPIPSVGFQYYQDPMDSFKIFYTGWII